MNKLNKNNPYHIAIIPDANRRWAKKRGMHPWKGHQQGAKNTEEVVKAAFDLDIPCFSLWGGSFENLTKRPKIEINALFKIYEHYFRKLIKDKDIHKNQVRVSVIGRWSDILPKKGVKVVKELINATKDYNKRFLNFFIAYNGTDEMLEAIKGISKDLQNNKGLIITQELLRKHLWSGDLPPVDLLIRTGSDNDPHNSVGFMMWNCANSQLYFTKEFYPDFGKNHLIKAVNDFNKRQRRFGK
ncbi:MAG: polyprenyl diphosphate synthase [bacterium]